MEIEEVKGVLVVGFDDESNKEGRLNTAHIYEHHSTRPAKRSGNDIPQQHNKQSGAAVIGINPSFNHIQKRSETHKYSLEHTIPGPRLSALLVRLVFLVFILLRITLPGYRPQDKGYLSPESTGKNPVRCGRFVVVVVVANVKEDYDVETMMMSDDDERHQAARNAMPCAGRAIPQF
jgi:hypothetical protein